jgi:hypothetical protein
MTFKQKVKNKKPLSSVKGKYSEIYQNSRCTEGETGTWKTLFLSVST